MHENSGVCCRLLVEQSTLQHNSMMQGARGSVAGGFVGRESWKAPRRASPTLTIAQKVERRKATHAHHARLNHTFFAYTTHTCLTSGCRALRVWLAKRVTSQKRRRQGELNRLFKRVTKPIRRQCFVALVRNRTACRKEKAEKTLEIQCWWR